MRPTYERAEDVEGQQRVIDRVCAAWRCSAQSAPKFYQHDFFLTRGPDVVAVAEVKRRTNAHDAYDTYMVSAHKWMNGVAWENSLRVPFLLIVEFTDGIWFCKPSECTVFVQWGGRSDRGDAQDMEAVVHVPMSSFRIIGDLARAA